MRFGLSVAAIACLLDQASKIYLLFVFDIAAREPVRIGPFIDIVLARNPGISYGLFQTQGPVGQWVLLGFKAVAVLFLLFWLAHAKDRLTGLSLGLIIGGAVRDAIERPGYCWGGRFVFFLISI